MSFTNGILAGVSNMRHWLFRFIFFFLAVLTPVGSGARAATQRGLEQQKEARQALEHAAVAAAAGRRTEFSRLLEEAAQRMESLAGERAIAPELQKELKAAATELRGRAVAPPAGFSPQTSLRLLEHVAAALRAAPSADGSFLGSFSQTKVQEPAYGGHASAMGPPPEAPPSTGGPSPVQFEEGPALSEKTFCGGRTKDSILESGGSGIALIDFDNDGLLDIYAVSAFELDDKRQRIPHPNALYRNLGGLKFKNVAREAGLDAAAWGNGVCAADFDGDGLIDLCVTNYGPNFLFKNNGDGTFTDVAAAAGVQGSGWSTGCAFFDANGDGHLDLYVSRYANVTWDQVVHARRTLTWRGGPKVMAGPVGFPGAADTYYENRGDGTFVDATNRRGLTDTAPSYGFGVVATDYDNDGWLDLYVANDSNPNFLYRNRGQGDFESVGLLSGVALNAEGRAQAGMGVDAGDYDNDGWMDLVVTNFAHDTSTLYRNLGNGLFTDVTQQTGLAGPTFEPMKWGVAFFDADLDGKLDLFFANGHIYPQVDEFPSLKETYKQKSQFFLNEGGTFRDVSATAGGGLQRAKSSRGLAVGDLDNDGDLDVVISNIDDVPTVLENRQRTGHHWVGFQLKKEGRNPFAIGARVTVEAGGRRQIREVRSGGSYLSQNDLRAHFGLGDYGGPVGVEVRLGQSRWRWKALPIDRYQSLSLREQDRVRP
jgi:enediyne biosynthesis protein E4